MRLLIVILILTLFLITSCEDVFVGSKPQPQPVESENVTDAELINETNETTAETPTTLEVFLPREDNLTLYFLDVKGDATIVHYEDRAALVDSGYEDDSPKVVSSIRNLGIENLDYVFATNTQPKRIGGMPYVILRTEPSNIVENGIPSNTTTYKELYNNTIVIKHDEVFSFDSAFIKSIVIYDDGSGFSSNPDDNSLITQISYGNTKFLLMSDCGPDCEERLRNTDISSDILKISNSCDATSLTFLQRVSPEIAIASTQDTDFCPNIKSRFSYLDIPLYTTLENGDIFVTTDGLDYKVGWKKE